MVEGERKEVQRVGRNNFFKFLYILCTIYPLAELLTRISRNLSTISVNLSKPLRKFVYCSLSCFSEINTVSVPKSTSCVHVPVLCPRSSSACATVSILFQGVQRPRKVLLVPQCQYYSRVSSGLGKSCLCNSVNTIPGCPAA